MFSRLVLIISTFVLAIQKDSSAFTDRHITYSKQKFLSARGGGEYLYFLNQGQGKGGDFESMCMHVPPPPIIVGLWVLFEMSEVG